MITFQPSPPTYSHQNNPCTIIEKNHADMAENKTFNNEKEIK
jgi:hypothetical protein